VLVGSRKISPSDFWEGHNWLPSKSHWQ